MDTRVWIVLVALLVTCQGMSYEDFCVYSAGPLGSEEQVDAVLALIDSGARGNKVQMLEEDIQEGGSVNLIVAPDIVQLVEAALAIVSIPFRVVERNVQRRLDEQRSRNGALRFRFPFDATTHYMSYSEQVEHLKTLAQNSDITQYSSLGLSYEGREMPLLTINGDHNDWPGVWLEAGLHAREWLAHATLIYITEKIINGRGFRSKSLRDNYRFYIAPNVNPDGYVYSWEEDRYWRKNRSPGVISDCPGVDLNRNFDVNFASCGVSDNPCSYVYPGPGPESEPETRAVVAGVKRVVEEEGGLDLFMDIHAYGQLWLIPWAGNLSKPDSYDDLEEVANAAANAITRRSGRVFQVGTTPDLLYCAAGGAQDWALNDGDLPGDGAGIEYSYTPEVRPALGCCNDSPLDGFSPDPDQIRPSGREMLAALFAALKAID